MVKIDLARIEALMLELNVSMIIDAIRSTIKTKLQVCAFLVYSCLFDMSCRTSSRTGAITSRSFRQKAFVLTLKVYDFLLLYVLWQTKTGMDYVLQSLQGTLPKVVVKGIKTIRYASLSLVL